MEEKKQPPLEPSEKQQQPRPQSYMNATSTSSEEGNSNSCVTPNKNKPNGNDIKMVNSTEDAKLEQKLSGDETNKNNQANHSSNLSADKEAVNNNTPAEANAAPSAHVGPIGPSLTTSASGTTSGPQQAIRYSRIFKKVSQDGNLVLFLPQRELMVSENRVEALMGVALIHENVVKIKDMRVYLQVVLYFRYGREDEELMGLRFCNEVVVAAEQIYPTAMEIALYKNGNGNGLSTMAASAASEKEKDENAKPAAASNSLVNNQGFLAVPFVVDMGMTAPPSIRLIPCRPYTGSPIGTSYEVQLFASHAPDVLPRRRKMVQMSLRVYERVPKELPPSSDVVLQKHYVFSDKPLMVTAKLDQGVYEELSTIKVFLKIRRCDENGRDSPSGHGVKKIKIMAVQQVGVAMFSTGNFKNNVGVAEPDSVSPRDPEFTAEIPVKIELGKDYAWAAMDETSKKDSELTHLAPTVTHANKALFVVRVTYYVQVILFFGLLQRPISLKLPFLLKRAEKKKSTTTVHITENTSKPAQETKNSNPTKDVDDNPIEKSKIEVK